LEKFIFKFFKKFFQIFSSFVMYAELSFRKIYLLINNIKSLISKMTNKLSLFQNIQLKFYSIVKFLELIVFDI